jgi:hypothetical protein
VKEINKLLYGFLWNKKDRIKRNVIIAPIKCGGINFIDVESLFLSLKASWMKRIYENETENWNCIARNNFKFLGNLNNILNTSFIKTQELPSCKKMSPFYQQVLIAYNRCKISKAPNTLHSLNEQFLWGNKHLKVYSKVNKCMTCLFFPNWIESGLLWIKDISLINGIIDTKYMKDNLKNKSNMLVECKTLQLALRPYRHLMTQYDNETRELDHACSKFSLLDNKSFYDHLVKQKYEKPNLKYMEMICEANFSTDEISKICHRKINSIHENKIKEFNYKMLHNIVACGSIVSKWCPDRAELCDICNVKETMDHLLWGCSIAKIVWRMISNAVDMVICKNHVFLGIDNYVLCYIVSVCSYTIYKYRIISWNKKIKRTPEGIKFLLQNEMKYRRDIYKSLEKWEFANGFRRVMQYITPQM